MSGHKLQDIAVLTRMIKDPISKKYITDRWEEIKNHDDGWADRFIELLATEDYEQLAELFY